MTAADDLRVAREGLAEMLVDLFLIHQVKLEVATASSEETLRAIERLIDAKIAEQLGPRIEDAIRDAARWRLFRPSIFGGS